MKNVIISNPEKFEELKKAFIKGGINKLHVLADFDRTLTTAFVNGKKIHSFIAILRDEGHLSEEYRKQAHALSDHYRPFEDDPLYPRDEKKVKMHKWWSKHFELLIKSGLNKKDLEKAIKSKNIKLRNGTTEFFNNTKKHNVPLIIISASGIGDTIPMYLEEKKILSKNVHILTNFYKWDSEGYATGVNEPFIHVMNKDETVTHNNPKIHDKIKNRKNVLLLGDSLGDVDMVTGFDYDNLIKVGFLNYDVEKNLDQYKVNYDIIITNDSSMNYVNDLLKEITQ